MKILLLSPPLFNPSGPYLAIPSLKAFLEQNGLEVIQRDINAEFFNRVLSSVYLTDCYKAICKKLRDLKAKKSFNEDDKRLLSLLRSRIYFAPYIIRKIDAARNFCKTKHDNKAFLIQTMFDLKRLWNWKILQSGLGIIGLRYYPTSLFLNNLNMRYSFTSSSDILQAVQDSEENPFLDFFKEHILPQVLSENPAFVGISINDNQQVIPGFTLSKLIKDKGLYVTIGGAIFTKELKIKKEFFRLCDSFVINEGEHALLELAKQLETERNFHNVPNLVWFDETNKNIIFNELNYIEDLDSLPTPDFQGLPVNSYFNLYSEDAIFPLCISKGCYWGKCAFCDAFHNNKYRVRNISLVIKDIINIVNKYSIRSFLFTGESIAPETIKEFSRAVIENNLDIRWEGHARFEADFTEEFCQLLAKAGCKRLYCGLESGSQRILDFMEKGTSLTSIKKILANLRKTGIAIYLFVMVGFPTETKAEAEETLNFILNNKDLLDCRDFGMDLAPIYYPCMSKLYRFARNYNIEKIITRNAHDDLEYRTKYTLVTSNSIPWQGTEMMARHCRKVISNRFYYYGLRYIIYEEMASQKNLLNFVLLLGKLARHHIGCKINNFLKGILRKRGSLKIIKIYDTGQN